MTQYQVTAPCVAHIPVMTPGGQVLDMFYKGAILPDGVPQDRLEHLLAGGMVRAVGGPMPDVEGPSEQEDSGEASEPVSDGEGPSPDAPPSVNSRSSKADLVEYGVAHRGVRAELEDMTRDQLLDRYVRQQP